MLGTELLKSGQTEDSCVGQGQPVAAERTRRARCRSVNVKTANLRLHTSTADQDPGGKARKRAKVGSRTNRGCGASIDQRFVHCVGALEACMLPNAARVLALICSPDGLREPLLSSLYEGPKLLHGDFQPSAGHGGRSPEPSAIVRGEVVGGDLTEPRGPARSRSQRVPHGQR